MYLYKNGWKLFKLEIIVKGELVNIEIKRIKWRIWILRLIIVFKLLELVINMYFLFWKYEVWELVFFCLGMFYLKLWCR